MKSAGQILVKIAESQPPEYIIGRTESQIRIPYGNVEEERA